MALDYTGFAVVNRAVLHQLEHAEDAALIPECVGTPDNSHSSRQQTSLHEEAYFKNGRPDLAKKHCCTIEAEALDAAIKKDYDEAEYQMIREYLFAANTLNNKLEPKFFDEIYTNLITVSRLGNAAARPTAAR